MDHSGGGQNTSLTTLRSLTWFLKKDLFFNGGVWGHPRGQFEGSGGSPPGVNLRVGVTSRGRGHVDVTSRGSQIKFWPTNFKSAKNK